MLPVSAQQSKTAIIFIDVQSAFRVPGYFGTERNNPSAEDNIQRVIDAARKYNSTPIASDANTNRHRSIEIIHIHHHSTNPNSPLNPAFILPDDTSMRGTDPLPCAKVIDGEAVFIKNVNSAFIGTCLEQHLRDRQIRQLLFLGLTTDHCVSTTVRMAANLGVVNDHFSKEQGTVFLLEDCCATFGKGKFPAELIHSVHIESLRGEFAEITTSGEVLRHVLLH